MFVLYSGCWYLRWFRRTDATRVALPAFSGPLHPVLQVQVLSLLR